MHYRLADARINSSTNCSKSCKKMVKIGSVVFESIQGRKWKVRGNCTIFAHLAYWHSGSAGPIFAIFTSNESVLSVDDRSGPLFWYLKGRCHDNQFWAKFAKWHTFGTLAFYNQMTIVLRINAFIATLIALHRVKNGENRFSCFWVKVGYKMKIVLRLGQSLPTLQHW